MPVVHDGLEQELGYVTKPFEQKHIRAQWDVADPLMQEISYNLIVGSHHEVDRSPGRPSPPASRLTRFWTTV